MTDVFVSYKREDGEVARRFVDALRESGISVWWDDGITPRQAWDREIEEAISAASVVAVLWSQRSVESEWVRTEAHFGKDKGKLVPALIEPCQLPIAFSLTQTVNLCDWKGDREDRQWRKLLSWISDLVAVRLRDPTLPLGIDSTSTNVYRSTVGSLPSGELVYDGAFITPNTPAGTVFRDGEHMPVMRVVPRGSFLLGGSTDDPDRAAHEGPQKRIDIPAPFGMGVYPILVAEYVNSGGSLKSAETAQPVQRGWFDSFRSQKLRPASTSPPPHMPGAPITNISFDDAQAFVDRLSSKSEQRYRLPSEAEWEYGCRAGSISRYSCGDTVDSTVAAFGLKEGPQLAGVHKPNKFGLYDMHGNVREWTADLWHDSYDLTPHDGRPSLEGHSSMRVVRGGGWSDGALMLRSSARMRATQSIRSEIIGFRVARSLG